MEPQLVPTFFRDEDFDFSTFSSPSIDFERDFGSWFNPEPEGGPSGSR
jgi:hypothetical protein